MSGTQKMARPQPVWRGEDGKGKGKGKGRGKGEGRGRGKGEGRGRGRGKGEGRGRGEGKGTRKGKGKGVFSQPSLSLNNVNVSPRVSSPFRSRTHNNVSRRIAHNIARRKANNDLEEVRKMVIKKGLTFKERKAKAKGTAMNAHSFNPAFYNAAVQRYKNNHMPVLSRNSQSSSSSPHYVNGEWPFRPPGPYHRSESPPYIPPDSPRSPSPYRPKSPKSPSWFLNRSNSPMYDPDNPRR
jgi:hypothetical protein